MFGSQLLGRRHALRAPLYVAMLAVGLVLPALSAPGAASAATARPPVQPLPSNLEQLRAQEAQQLYGSPDIRPIEQRKTALITLGDSQISGEGVGNYEEGTHQNGNWCDRSRDQAVWRLGIAADVRYNVACSGAEPAHLVFGGPHQWNERNQGDNLAIKARNTRVKLVWIVVGANGEGTIQFGPVATDCVKRRIFFLGPCYGTYSDGWAARVDGSRRAVEQAVTSVKQTMTDAGYLTEDYELALMSYPSPGGPDVEDNPNFPGWYRGGCLIYLHDAAFARNKAVPLFERGIRAAAANTGVRYLDASRLFHGHGVCDDNPWVRGVYIENGNIFDENAARQSLHPNYLGHGAFARCMTDFYNSGWSTATCFDPASTRTTTLVNGLLEFRQLRNLGSGGCADGEGYNSRNGTQLLAWTCHGGRNQGFWYDPGRRSLHVELSQDRCVDAEGGVIAPGTRAILWDCHGLANQAWVFDGTAIHPAGSASLCLAFDATGNGARLRLAPCNGSAIQQWAFESRDYANPVGYNHADFIGSRVY